MKKALLSVFSLLSVGVLSAQTIVSTNAEDRNVVLEEFTGIYCQFCPDGHKRANQLKADNPGRVVLSNIHTNAYGTPSGNDPDYRTPFGEPIDDQAGVAGYPAGTINRENFVSSGWTQGSGTAMSRGDWAAAAAVVLAEQSPVNIAAEATIDVSTRVMSVLVEVYYTDTAGLDAMDNLNVAILQNGLKGPQTGASTWYPEQIDANGLYEHNHMLRHMLTGQWGEQLTVANGPFFSRTYTYTLPASYTGVGVEIGNLEVIAFIANDNQYIYTGDYADITFTGITATNDAAVENVGVALSKVCGTEIEGVTYNLRNNGSATITSATYDVSVNGTLIESRTWTGSLTSLLSSSVQVAAIDISAIDEADEYVVEINLTAVNSAADENTADNTGEVSVFTPTEGYADLTLELVHDRYASEVGITVTSSTGAVVYQLATGSLADLASNTTGTVTATIEWSVNDCFDVELTDSYGDGMGWAGVISGLTITDSEGTVLVDIAGDSYSSSTGDLYQHTESLEVITPEGTEDVENSIFSVYPNPAKDVIYISGTQGFVNVTVYDVQGRTVKQVSTESNTIQVSDLNSGMYMISVENNDVVSNTRISIVK